MIGFLRRVSARRAPAPAPEAVTLNIAGKDIPLRFRRNGAARRMVLRLDAKTGGLVMTLPARTGLAEALRFAEQSRLWIIKSLARAAPTADIADGATLLYRGQYCRLSYAGGRRGVVSISEDVISIPGEAAHVPRRLKDFLKRQALAALSDASQRYATAMATRFTRISVRDQKSRWGSCSAKGVLSYSWRLILAPEHVLDYVAAHEVAHLREMNHGPRFWRLVLTHCPHARAAKQWLKAHGRDVHRYL